MWQSSVWELINGAKMPKIADDFDLNDGYQDIYRDTYGNRYNVTQADDQEI